MKMCFEKKGFNFNFSQSCDMHDRLRTTHYEFYEFSTMNVAELYNSIPESTKCHGVRVVGIY
jgi:hypothetical protein